MKKEIPILFCEDMVSAILAGRKTMTRRIMKLQPHEVPNEFLEPENDPSFWVSTQSNRFPTEETMVDNDSEEFLKLSPYGKPQDLLFVRETHYQFGEWKPRRSGPGLQFFADKSMRPWLRYMEDKPSSTGFKGLGWHKRPSLFLPKEFSRIWLEVTERKAERLHDISEEDAMAEGVQKNCDGNVKLCPGCKNECQAAGEWCNYCGPMDDFPTYSAQESFFSLWQKINGIKSLEENPWTWATTFQVVSTTGKNFIKHKTSL